MVNVGASQFSLKSNPANVIRERGKEVAASLSRPGERSWDEGVIV